MRILFIILGLLLYTAKSQIIIHQYHIIWTGSGVTANGIVTFNSDFNNHNPSSIGINDYNGSASNFITDLQITVTGDPVSAYNGTFTLGDYDDAQWNTGGNTLNLNTDLVPQLGNGADFSLIANTSTFAPTSEWSDPLLTLRTGNGNGSLMTMQSFSAVPEPEEWMAITSIGLIGFGMFYKKLKR